MHELLSLKRKEVWFMLYVENGTLNCMVIREAHVAVPRINRRHHIIEREKICKNVPPCGFFLFSSSSSRFFVFDTVEHVVYHQWWYIKVQPSIADYCLDSCG